MAAFVCNRTRTERLTPSKNFVTDLNPFKKHISSRFIYVAAGWLSGVTNALAKRAPQVPKNKLQNPKNIDYKILDIYNIIS